MHPPLAKALAVSDAPVLVGSRVPNEPGAHFLVDDLVDDRADAGPSAGELRIDSSVIIDSSMVTVLDAKTITDELDALDADDVAAIILDLHAADKASWIAGVTLAVISGVRAIVTDDVAAARRVTLMASRMLVT